MTDVAFVDAEHGWAVGDWGTIWQTTDGGARWELQASGVGCRLESVQFVDAQNGWAAGGLNHPYSQTTHGVLLRTHDGGRTWQRDNNLMLPALKRVKFFNAGRGWALGQSSPLFATGLFSTDDAGRSWAPQCGTSIQSWSTGDFLDATTGMVASRSGSLGAAQRGAIEEQPSPGGLRNVRRIKFSGPKSGWLVGDGGLILTTADRGRSWQPPASGPAQMVGTDFDFQALEVRDAKCWIAGSPGTRVMYTGDGGQSWQAFATGQNAPLTAISFVDEQHGWAVGELGVILRTSDGGRTWQRQRSTAKRAALLAFFSEPANVPLELIARVSGNEGFLSAVRFVNRLDVETHTQSTDSLAERGHAALAAVGASSARTAWAFPIRQPGVAISAEQLVATWDRIHNGQGLQRLEAYLVREIRCWRPEVIVTHAASPRGDDLLGHTINQVVLRAAEQAADAQRFPEQITQLGLEPWQPRKVLGALPEGQLGTINLTSSQLAPRLGCSLADAADTARALLFDSYTGAPATIGFQLLVDHVPQGAGAQDIMSGITLYPGGEARRLLGDAADATNDLMRRVAQKHRSLQAILVHLGKRGQDTQRV
ncbi:MAG TPA: YCF48-related protein, partial [Pirellulales bacterium]|nr:YCF48-related protein [Pirellulales bacterium]